MSTTIEILQAYPLGTLEVESLAWGGRAIVTGLPGGDEVLCGHKSIKAANCLPVLRPFSALCTPLEDGTVPAVEVAKMIKLLRENDKVTLCEYFPNHRQCGNCIRIERAHDWSVRITESDWNALFWRGFVIDYLRKNHFAVGLTPDQYIAK